MTAPGIPAITLWEPYATLMAMAVKRIETRSWKAPAALIGQRFVIHAAARKPKDGLDADGRIGDYTVVASQVTRGRYDIHRTDTPRGGWVRLSSGAVVCSARLVGCYRMFEHIGQIGDHAPGIVPLDVITLFTGQETNGQDITDQIPYGFYEPGRFGWLFEDIVPTTKGCPACFGGPVVLPVCPSCGGTGGRFDATFVEGGCTTCDGHGVHGICTVCNGERRCDPVPARGGQRVWRWRP